MTPRQTAGIPGKTLLRAITAIFKASKSQSPLQLRKPPKGFRVCCRCARHVPKGLFFGGHRVAESKIRKMGFTPGKSQFVQGKMVLRCWCGFEMKWTEVVF
jgi:hypothetical protein